MKKRQVGGRSPFHRSPKLDTTHTYLSDAQKEKRIREHLQWLREGGATCHEVDFEDSPIDRWMKARGNGNPRGKRRRTD